MSSAQKVLLYSVPKEIHREISALCREINVECKKIPKARFCQSIGCHAGIVAQNVSADGNIDELPEPMLVFSGLSDKKLDEFLAGYKEKNIENIPLKAIVTKYNIGCTTRELFDELCKERAQIKPV